MWSRDEVREAHLVLDGDNLEGTVRLQTEQGDRGYEAELRGTIEKQDDAIVRFDMVALGKFWGEGRYTRRAPPGKFPLAISFTLADGTDIADAVPPQAARGWLQGYLK